MLLSNDKSLSESEKMQNQNSILVQTSFSPRLLGINSIRKTDSDISITFLEEKDEKPVSMKRLSDFTQEKKSSPFLSPTPPAHTDTEPEIHQ